nr:hypothetical protein CFP56_68796 [Quercus suber]
MECLWFGLAMMMMLLVDLFSSERIDVGHSGILQQRRAVPGDIMSPGRIDEDGRIMEWCKVSTPWLSIYFAILTTHFRDTHVQRFTHKSKGGSSPFTFEDNTIRGPRPRRQ